MEDPQKKIKLFYKDNKRMPTYSEMMKLFDYKSKNAVSKLVEKMISVGFVAKDHLGRLIPTSLFEEIPVFGLVKAGIPMTAEEIKDTLNLNEFFVKKPEDTFILEVDGDSMIDAHIEEGDMILVEKANEARSGDIVVAEVDGEFTLKYFYKEGNKIWLDPANTKYKRIYPKDTFSIVGILKAVMRKY